MGLPKLSICIATLNRAAFIGATLESIISQATDEVEIVIVDGASTDNTEQVVRHYQQRFPRLRYVRLAARGGVDQDYSRAVELAQGEYCWLMSDDDVLKPGAVQAVIEATRHPYSLIIVNTEMCNTDLSKQLRDRQLSIHANQVYTPADNMRLFVETSIHLSYIGSVVIRRQLWNMRDKERYFGTAFVHVGVIFQSPLPENTLVIAEPLVSIRSANASWSAKYFEIWMFKWPSLVWSFPDYPETAKRQVFAKEPWRRPGALLICRAKGAYSISEYARWLEPRLESPVKRLVSKTIAQMPGCLVNFLAILYFSIFRPYARADLLDFQTSPFYFLNCLHRASVNTFGENSSAKKLPTPHSHHKEDS